MILATFALKRNTYDDFRRNPVDSNREGDNENQGFYNLYYIDNFKINNPVVERFSNRDNNKVYIFSEDILYEYLKDTTNFILRNDVYEYYRYINPDTWRYTKKSWKYFWCSLPIPNYEEEFEAKFKFSNKYYNMVMDKLMTEEEIKREG